MHNVPAICYRTSVPSSRFKLLYCPAKQTERLLVARSIACVYGAYFMPKIYTSLDFNFLTVSNQF